MKLVVRQHSILLRTVDIAASLDEDPLSVTITPLHLTVVSNSEAADSSGNEHAPRAAGSLRMAGRNPRLTIVSDIRHPA
ncbi:hypothetical protein [Burkholderia sp. PU8-34]